MPEVSVIIPCYNAERFLAEAIDSVMKQTHLPLEVICINDGSKDATLDLLYCLAENNPLITVATQQNQGAPTARNLGLDMAGGDYLQFLDADDTLHPDKLKTQLALVSANQEPDLVVGAYQKFDASGKLIHTQLQSDSGVSFWLKLMRTDLGITSSNLFKRISVIKAGKWNETMKSSQEYELMFRMMKNNARICLSPEEHTVIHQRNPDSITATSKEENWKRYISLRLDMRTHALQRGEKVNVQALDQIIFDSLRMLYPYDSEESLRLHKQELSSKFSPQVSNITSQGYVRMYRLLGFKRAEQLRKIISK